MAETKKELAAIMFTDLVGYTALMGSDSEKALRVIRQSKQIQKPLVERYHGEWLKEMGDGAMIKFHTAQDAVYCALEIQRKSRIDFEGRFRIGIHLGDVVIEDNDIYGDGVNVAARLESVADPGGIYISESIEKAIQGQVKIKAEYLGELQLKNVGYAVRTYALQGEELPSPEISKIKNRKVNFKAELLRRDMIRAAIVYIIFALLIFLVFNSLANSYGFHAWTFRVAAGILILLFPVAIYLAWKFEKSPDGFIKTTSLQSIKNPLPPGKRKPLTGTNTILVLLSVLLLLYFYPEFSKKDNPAEEASLIPGSFKKSIAVLPFKNLSGNEDNLYFSDGVMEAILNNLSRIRDLKVVSRTSVEQYRNEEKPIREIAHELEVANILEGSVQRIGDEVRITVQLISAENDEHIWADNYDRQLTDIFGIQSEIAQTIAENLEVIMTMEERELIRNSPTSNLKAYDNILKVRNHKADTKEEILWDIDKCREAIVLDPDFGMAYAFLSNACKNLGFYGYPRTFWYDSAMRLVNMAIQKDPKTWESYMIKGNLHHRVHEDQQAIRSFRKVLELNPNSFMAYYNLGYYAMMYKNYDEAINFLLKSITLNRSQIDPSEFEADRGFFLRDLDIELAYESFKRSYADNPDMPQVLEELYNCARYYREYDKALEYAIRYRQLKPDLINAKNIVAESYLLVKDYEKAEKQYIEMINETDRFENNYMIYPFVHRLGYVKMMNGNKQEGIEIMENYRDTLIARVNRKEINAYGIGEYYDIAVIQASLGNRENALEWLKMARDRETEGAFYRADYLLSDPMLDNLRDDPEFQNMLEAKIREKEEIRRIFHEKLDLYHSNNELKWLADR